MIQEEVEDSVPPVQVSSLSVPWLLKIGVELGQFDLKMLMKLMDV